MRILILLLLLNGTVLQSEPKNVYATQSEFEGKDQYYYDDDGDEEEYEHLIEKKLFTPEEQKEINKILGGMTNDIAQKIINLDKGNYKARKKSLHEFTIYLLSVYNSDNKTKNYKYRYEQLKYILSLIVDTYQKTDDVELKFNLMEVMELTYHYIHFDDMIIYASKSFGYGDDERYAKQMIESNFKDFLKELKIEKLIDLNEIEEDDDD